MTENFNYKKFGADKIAFLGLFLVATLIANFLVSMRSVLRYTEPIELEHAGLAIAIPVGKSWQSIQQWKYEDNEFVLNANLVSNPLVQLPTLPKASVNCIYTNAVPDITPEIMLEQKLGEIKKEEIKTGRIEKDNMIINWAQVDRPVKVIEAVAELTDNRMLTIEVFETTFEIDIAERIFKEVVDSISFNEDNLIKTSTAFINEIKSRGIDKIINPNMQSCFFVQDSAKKNIGFMIDLLGFLNSDEGFPVRGASDRLYTGSNALEEKTLFRCSKDLNNFLWQTRLNTKEGRSGDIITYDETGTINVTNMSNRKPRQYLNISNVVPAILLESFITPMVESKIEEVVVDIIDSDGRLLPALFNLKPSQQSDTDYANIVTLKFLDGRGVTESFYLNENNQIIRADGTYYLQRTDIDSIEKEYPGMAGYISEQMNLLDSYAI